MESSESVLTLVQHNCTQQNKIRLQVASVAFLFITWSVLFIYRTTFVGIDDGFHFCLVDDAMISMRYAWNLCHGNGLVWNPGEYVEGYTNLLMVLYMALSILIFGKKWAILFVQASGVGFLLLVGFLTMRLGTLLSDDLGAKGKERIAPVIFFCMGLSYYPLNYWSLYGMETGLLTALYLAAVAIAFRDRSRVPHVTLIPVISGLMFLLRQESILLIAPLFIFRFADLSRHGTVIRVFCVELLIFAPFAAGLEAFRWFYYGAIVPNTYTLKVAGIPFMERIKNGYHYSDLFLCAMSIPVALAVLNTRVSYNRRKLLILATFVLLGTYQIWVGGDAWPPHWRLVVPAIPLVLILATTELRRLIKLYAAVNGRLQSPTMAKSPWSGRSYVGALVVMMLVVNFSYLFALVPIRDLSGTNRNNVNIAIALKELCLPSATAGVFWAGAIPYFTGFEAVDFLGKTDPYIASLPANLKSVHPVWTGMTWRPGHCKYDLQYSVERKRPTFVQEFSWEDQSLIDYALEHYRHVQYKGVRLWLRRDSKSVLWHKLESSSRVPRRQGEMG